MNEDKKLEEIMLENLHPNKDVNLSDATSLIGTAMEIFDDLGMHKQSDKLINFLNKIAKKNKDLDLMSEIENIYDDDGIDELLASDIDDLSHADNDIQTDFEDE